MTIVNTVDLQSLNSNINKLYYNGSFNHMHSLLSLKRVRLHTFDSLKPCLDSLNDVEVMDCWCRDFSQILVQFLMNVICFLSCVCPLYSHSRPTEWVQVLFVAID